VGAHVTLFHALPAHLREDVEAELGRGVAYGLVTEEAQRLHRRLQERWPPHLTRQDAEPFRPHVTVQNKVEPQLARETLARLRASFRPETTLAVGLELWRYDDGPWTLLRRWAFGCHSGPDG
jgi:2'-5' RNA ligase